jgi:hypothetical protein
LPRQRRLAAGRRQQPPEPLHARGIEADGARQHLAVQGLEVLRVRAHDVVERVCGKAHVRAVDRVERRPGAVAVIEQRVVEIEEDGTQHGAPGGAVRDRGMAC